MARMPRLTLPDASHLELPEGEPVGSGTSGGRDRGAGGRRAPRSLLRSERRRRAWSPWRATDDDGLHVLRHSTAHVMAQAVCALHPGAKYAIGPAIDDGFYYDFQLPEPLSSDDLPAIEEKMRELVAADQPFVREEVSRAEALERLADQPFKAEIVEGLERRGRRGRLGRLGDACTATTAGPTCVWGPTSLPPARLGAFKLTSVAGAYWRGDESRPMLTRIYGTAWATQADLDAYLVRLEEAEKRDHRKLGRQLDLFSSPDELGPGLWLWHARGGIFRKELEDYVRDLHLERGYDLVVTPHLARRNLWDTSGHTAKYIDNMYPVMDDGEGNEYFVKPMNCPFHVLIYKSQVRSYRDLPMRIVGARNDLPVRASGRAPRIAPDPRRHPGRLAHHLHPRAAGRRDPGGLRPHARDPSHVRFLGADRAPVHEAGSRDRGARDVGARDGSAPASARQERAGLRGGRRRGRVLRPEGRLPFQGRDRAALAAHHRAVRLRAARAVRYGVLRRGQPAAPAGRWCTARSWERSSGSAPC